MALALAFMALALAFDTLKLARKLEAAGLAYQQAADISDALADAFAIAEVATKADLRESEHRLMAEITAARTEARESEHTLKAELAAMRAEAKAMELRMTIKLGGLIAAGVAVLAAMKFFGH